MMTKTAAEDDPSTPANEALTTEVSTFADGTGQALAYYDNCWKEWNVPAPVLKLPQHRLLVVISVREQDLER